jgi:hypothetical protein
MKRYSPLLFLLLSTAALAESGAYRVEVIVFRNLLATDAAAEVSELRSFSEFPDLEDAGNLEGTGDITAPPKALSPAVGPDGDVIDEPVLPLRDDLPDDLVVVTEKTNQMDTAWKRLRSSQNYRPLVYAAWDQNRVDYYPPIRIHNEQLIDTQLRAPTPIMMADLTKKDPLGAYRSQFFQIDGSLQLRRSRFLHLSLDLEIREEKAKNPVPQGPAGDDDVQIEGLVTADTPVAYGVHALKQDRQINTGRMQYFDTPYFGALVYVSSIPVN